jgi:hypothetical protein
MSPEALKNKSLAAKKRTAEGRNNHFVGCRKGIAKTEEQKRKQSEAMKGRHLGEKHPEHSKRMIEIAAENEGWGFKNAELRIPAQAKRPPGFNSGLKSGNYIHGMSRTLPYNAERERRRRARIKTPESANRLAILKIYRKAHLMTLIIGRQYDVDHIIPVSRGGLHHEDNLQILTHAENIRKSNKLMSPLLQAVNA